MMWLVIIMSYFVHIVHIIIILTFIIVINLLLVIIIIFAKSISITLVSWHHPPRFPQWTNLSDTTSHKRIGECVQAILLYEGRYVPVRDIQRLRLSSMTSQEIRSTMEFLNSTREGKVGCYREIRGGIGVFYKCPPHLVDMEFLESFGLTLAIYETRYSSRMVSNATNRHSAVYWYRIETCSPYLTSTEVL